MSHVLCRAHAPCRSDLSTSILHYNLTWVEFPGSCPARPPPRFDFTDRAVMRVWMNLRGTPPCQCLLLGTRPPPNPVTPRPCLPRIISVSRLTINRLILRPRIVSPLLKPWIWSVCRSTVRNPVGAHLQASAFDLTESTPPVLLVPGVGI